MASIFITQSFQQQLKKFRRTITEEIIISNLRDYDYRGLRSGEAKLQQLNIAGIPLEIIKLRLSTATVQARYLVGVVKTDRNYLPFFVDLKKGRYGKNLGLQTDKRTQRMVLNAAEQVIEDFVSHSEAYPRMTKYDI